MMERTLRKIFLFMMLSIDGYFEGPNHDISWHRVDDETNRLAIGFLKDTDLMLWGRRVYQTMEAAWPGMAKDPSTSRDNVEIARLINNVNKVVFSRTLESVRETENWKNVRLVREFDPAEIRRLKEQSGKDISVGGSDLAVSFVRAGLIDEFRFMVAPVVVGAGTQIFQGLSSKLDLELTGTRTFHSGNVLHYYRARV